MLDFDFFADYAPDADFLEDPHRASYVHKLIMKEIRDFEETLDDEHEVFLKLASFGKTITLAVTEIGYANPNTLFFYGFVDKQPATLIQHQSQLNLLLLSMKREDFEGTPRRVVGFDTSPT